MSYYFFQLYVTASDRSFDTNDVRAVTATVTVNVERNQAPVIANKNSYQRTISESVGLNDVIMTIAATDPNPSTSLNGMLDYSIVTGDALNKFQIDGQGNIRPRVELRDITDLDWVFDVMVADRGIPPLSDTTSVRINIQQIDRPYFEPPTSNYRFIDNTTVGTQVLRIQARDPTPDGPLMYEIRGDGLAPQYFTLEMDGDDAVVYVNKSFIEDTTYSLSYDVRIHAYRVRDPNIYTQHIASVFITRNPGTPYFLHGEVTFYIDENYQPNDLVGRINATDEDPGENGEIVYRITNEDLNPLYTKEYFIINEVTGDLRVTGDLQLDPTTELYAMRVSARDRGVPQRSNNIMVYVNVTRNEGIPFFINTPYTAVLNETVHPDTFVIQVSARDDDGDVVNYRLQDTPPASLYFKIDQQTGVISTDAYLYEDTVTSYTIKVFAYDLNAASREVEANVEIFINRNPNPPSFGAARYDVTISEYEDIGEYVTTLLASDPDTSLSDGGVLRYSFGTITPTTAETWFDISPTLGEITVASQLINNPTADLQVELQVLAYDRSVNPKTAETTLVVNIVRNENPPVFVDGDYYSVNIYDHTFVPADLYQLSASDEDTSNDYNRGTPNAQVYYFIKEDPNSNDVYFEVTQTGMLRLISNVYNAEGDHFLVSTRIFMSVYYLNELYMSFSCIFGLSISFTAPVFMLIQLIYHFLYNHIILSQ